MNTKTFIIIAKRIQALRAANKISYQEQIRLWCALNRECEATKALLK